jgi:tetratricopeptide (TPR) repeat protein
MGRRPAKRHKSATSIKEHADSLAEEGRLDEAIEEYRSLIVIDPADPCAHFSLCDAYHKKGMIDEALTEIDESMRLRPGWPFYHNKKGKLLEDKGDFKGAAFEYGEALRIKPDFAVAKGNLKSVEERL